MLKNCPVASNANWAKITSLDGHPTTSGFVNLPGRQTVIWNFQD